MSVFSELNAGHRHFLGNLNWVWNPVGWNNQTMEKAAWKRWCTLQNIIWLQHDAFHNAFTQGCSAKKEVWECGNAVPTPLHTW